MEIGNLQRRYLDFTSTLFHEGFLDNQFTQLQQLQDESNPEFVLEVVTLFFEDSEKLLNELSRTLNQQVVDFKKVDAHVHQLKGSSARFLTFENFLTTVLNPLHLPWISPRSIGAQRVKNVCVTFRNFCEEMNREGCLRCLQQVKNDYFLVKNKLETLFALEHQIVAAGGSVPMMW